MMLFDVVVGAHQTGSFARVPPRAPVGENLDQDLDRFAIAGATSRLWRPGDRVERGELLGATVDGGRPVHARGGGRVTSIEYDVDRDEVILVVEPSS
jgi:hypothetical protein